MSGQIAVVLPYLLALLLASVLSIAGLVQYRLGALVSPETRVILVLSLLAAGAILSYTFGTRNLDETQLALTSAREALEDAAGGFAASRLFSAFVVGAGSIEVVRGWLHARSAKVADPARPVLLCLLGLYVGTMLVQGIASEEPSFSYKNFYPLIALLAVYYQRVENLPRIIATAKFAVLALTAGSLLMIAFRPDSVLQRPAVSVLPGINFRLFGLSSHANTIGPVALLGIVLELAYPSKLKALRWLQLGAAAVVLVLAQSKTAWVAGLLMIPIVGVPLAMAARPGDRGDRFTRSVLVLLLVIAMAVGATVVLGLFNVAALLEDKVAGVTTLTGRTQIWDITLAAWRDNVLFGYGGEIWGYERRVKFGMLYVGQAHNQFIQTLGDSGLVGLILLLVYLGVLLHASLKWFVDSRGVMPALMILILARCMTEAPMRTVELISWPLLTHLLLLIMACYYMRRPVVPAAPARQQAAGRSSTPPLSAPGPTRTD